jgi:hypothetical protein
MHLAGALFAEMRMAGEDAVRPSEDPGPPAPSEEVEVLAEALALAVRVERLLAHPVPELEVGGHYRMRLARAHVLGLIDQLSVMVGPRAHGALNPPR